MAPRQDACSTETRGWPADIAASANNIVSMDLRAIILSIVEAKGWHLYRALPGSDFAGIVHQGKAHSIEPNVLYVMFPAASRHADVDGVRAHVDNARRTNQLPTYGNAEHPNRQVEFIGITEAGLNVKVRDEAGVYLVGTRDMEDAIKSNLSTYNVHFFSSIDDLSEFFLRQGIREQTSSLLPRQLRWEYVLQGSPSDQVVIRPSNPSPVLFRGQYRRYRPCYPTAARGITAGTNALHGLPERDQACVVLNLIRTQWFKENLRHTPAMRWMSSQKIAFDDTAVAQHYGLPTGYIDLSQSFEVSSFFACCRYYPDSQEWRPVDNGEGVMYVVDVRHPDCGTVRPICLQAFPRPSEQWAWVYEMAMSLDFDMLPHVRKFMFRHDAGASQRILQRFNGGAALFPPDALSEVADTIMRSQSVPKVVAARVVADVTGDPLGLPAEDVQSVLDKIERQMRVTCSKSQAPFVVTQVMMEEMDKIWVKRFAGGKDIGMRLVRRVRARSS